MLWSKIQHKHSSGLEIAAGLSAQRLLSQIFLGLMTNKHPRWIKIIMLHVSNHYTEMLLQCITHHKNITFLKNPFFWIIQIDRTGINKRNKEIYLQTIQFKEVDDKSYC